MRKVRRRFAQNLLDEAIHPILHPKSVLLNTKARLYQTQACSYTETNYSTFSAKEKHYMIKVHSSPEMGSNNSLYIFQLQRLKNTLFLMDYIFFQ